MAFSSSDSSLEIRSIQVQKTCVRFFKSFCFVEYYLNCDLKVLIFKTNFRKCKKSDEHLSIFLIVKASWPSSRRSCSESHLD